MIGISDILEITLILMYETIMVNFLTTWTFLFKRGMIFAPYLPWGDEERVWGGSQRTMIFVFGWTKIVQLASTSMLFMSNIIYFLVPHVLFKDQRGSFQMNWNTCLFTHTHFFRQALWLLCDSSKYIFMLIYYI